jgi:triacylglycerol lipase
MVAESRIFGLVAWSASTSTAIVAIRGTKTIWEWLGDFDAAPVPWLPKASDGLVHMGFQLVYEHIGSSLRNILTANCKAAKRVLVTGHSLGGAVAVLAAFDIFESMGFTVVPELYTFAGHRAAAPDFAGHFGANIKRAIESSSSWIWCRRFRCPRFICTSELRCSSTAAFAPWM